MGTLCGLPIGEVLESFSGNNWRLAGVTLVLLLLAEVVTAIVVVMVTIVVLPEDFLVVDTDTEAGGVTLDVVMTTLGKVGTLPGDTFLR